MSSKRYPEDFKIEAVKLVLSAILSSDRGKSIQQEMSRMMDCLVISRSFTIPEGSMQTTMRCRRTILKTVF